MALAAMRPWRVFCFVEVCKALHAEKPKRNSKVHSYEWNDPLQASRPRHFLPQGMSPCLARFEAAILATNPNFEFH
jgi:hypothetical protein